MIVQIFKNAWDDLIKYLQGIEVEKGGVAIGFRDKESKNTTIIGFCFFKQIHHSSVFCEFDPADMLHALSILANLNEKYNPEHPIGIMAWVHTHPNSGIFLSGTDEMTLANFSAIDKNLVALVIDAYNKNYVKYGAFIKHEGKSIKIDCNFIEIADFNNLETYWNEFKKELKSRLKHSPLEFISSLEIKPKIASLSYYETERLDDLQIMNKFSDFHKSIIKKRRKKIKLNKARGESYSFIGNYGNDGFSLDKLLLGSKETYIRLCQEEAEYFELAIPSTDVAFCASNLPDILKTPLIKSLTGNLTGYESGQRSALLFDSNVDIIYRLKGCGQDTLGFLLKNNKYVSGKSYKELRGSQFQRTCLREQLITLILRDKLIKKNILVGNFPLGWWIYFDSYPVNPYCGLFSTEGDLRLKDDILYSIESLIPMLFDNCNLNILPEEITSRMYKNMSAILFNDAQLVDLRKYDFSNISLSNFINKVKLNNSNFEIYNFIPYHKDINLGHIYWKLGSQMGFIKRSLEEEDFIWGTFLDPREAHHFNAHGNNFILNLNKNGHLNLSPVDFDLAFNRESFIQLEKLKNDYSFDSLFKIEKSLLQYDIVDGITLIGFDQPSISLQEPYNALRSCLRETMILGFLTGYNDKYTEILNIEELYFLLICLDKNE